MPGYDSRLPIRYPGRRFQVWRYLVSHGQLLLRSTRGGTRARRIDILFKAVRRMDLPTLMDDVEITMAGEDEVPAAARGLGAWDGVDATVYRVAGRGFAGWVTAGSVAAAENEGDYDEPGPFDAPGL